MPTRNLVTRTRLSLLPLALATTAGFLLLPTCKCSAPDTFPRKGTCTPVQAWSSNAQCVDVILESDLQWFQGYTIESGVPTRDFCRPFFNSPGPARDSSCTKPNAYKKVACKTLGIREGASCFICDGASGDERQHHLRAFLDDCSLGLSIKAVNVELSQSMCDATAAPLCGTKPKAKTDGQE